MTKTKTKAKTKTKKIKNKKRKLNPKTQKNQEIPRKIQKIRPAATQPMKKITAIIRKNPRRQKRTPKMEIKGKKSKQ